MLAWRWKRRDGHRAGVGGAPAPRLRSWRVGRLPGVEEEESAASQVSAKGRWRTGLVWPCYLFRCTYKKRGGPCPYDQTLSPLIRESYPSIFRKVDNYG
jgi:hypothetical protein